MAPTSPSAHAAFQFDSNILPLEQCSRFANLQQSRTLSLPLSTCCSFAWVTTVRRQFRYGGPRHGRERGGGSGGWLRGGRRGISCIKGGGSGGSRGRGGGERDSGAGDEGGEDGTSGGGVSILSWYLDMLQKYPLLTNSISSAFLNLLGDLICQIFFDQSMGLDTRRLAVITSLGIVLVGPTLHFWFYYLNRLVVLRGPLGSLLRLLIDQFLFSPLFIGVFLCGLITLEGRTSQVVPVLQQEWLSVVLASWRFWIPFQFLNFQFVPPERQLLAANVAALAWNVIVSFNIHKEVIMN